jgi:TolB-like protein/Flp pilus assembly protein TadD
MAEQAKYRLDLGDERLWHGDQPVQISNKAFQLLRLFVGNPNRLLTKDHILDAVWGDVCVSEGLVKEYVHDLRKSLGDDPKQPCFIETVHGRGYRFLGGVEQSAGSSGAEPRKEPGTQPPSLAVLPFVNLSGDPDQEYFSDGVSEDITTELSRFRSLFVIARNTSYTYKGRATKVQDIGRDLGVRYVVEGSVRRAGKRVRATAQLIETATGGHIWADRYECELEDIISLQDEITRAIAAAIEPELGNVERRRSRLKAPEGLDAWDWYQRGLWHMYQDTRAGNIEARRQFEKAIELGSDFAPAYAASAYVLFEDIVSGYREHSDDSIDEAIGTAERAIALDEKDAMAHMVLGRTSLLRCQHEDSIAELETAIKLNPNYADAYHGLGFSLTVSGRPEEAIPQHETAIRLSPHDPRLSSFHEMRAWALIVLGRHEEALISARTSVRRPNAQLWAYATLSSVLGHLDLRDEARLAREEVLKRKPNFSLGFVRRFVYYNKVPAQLERYIDGLRKAGLPEKE